MTIIAGVQQLEKVFKIILRGYFDQKIDGSGNEETPKMLKKSSRVDEDDAGVALSDFLDCQKAFGFS